MCSDFNAQQTLAVCPPKKAVLTPMRMFAGYKLHPILLNQYFAYPAGITKSVPRVCDNIKDGGYMSMTEMGVSTTLPGKITPGGPIGGAANGI